MTDLEAWQLYPQDRWVYDKRVIADLYGVKHGRMIPEEGKYCIKPIVNLMGCSVNSKIVHSPKGAEILKMMEWFEFLEGPHWTADYVRVEGVWEMRNAFRGFPNKDDHTRFDKWVRMPETFYQHIPLWLKKVQQANVVNVEFIGHHAIEAHLRGNTDPVMYDEFYPVWEEGLDFVVYGDRDIIDLSNAGYQFIVDEEDHPGRIGFYVK